MPLSSLEKTNLEVQGFRCDSPEFPQSYFWLRVNPTICLGVAIYGYVTESAFVFFVLAGIAGIGALFPRGAGEYIYEYIIRRFIKKPSLPRTPPPRRFACVVGMLWSFFIALAYTYSLALIAHILAIAFFIVVIPMVVLHYCIASVIYQKIIGRRKYK